jgi:hypothetical protein
MEPDVAREMVPLVLWSCVVEQSSDRGTPYLQQCPTRGARCRRKNSGPWTRVSVRSEILGCLCRRATAQSDTSLNRELQSLRRLAMELNKPKARWKQEQIERKIQRWLSAPFLTS